MTKMKRVLKNIIRIIFKVITSVIMLFTMLITKTCFAATVDEVTGGGSIQESKLAVGAMNMVKDLTGTLQWLIPTAGVLVILFYVFKIMTGDEQDQQRYKKTIIKVLICIIVSILAVTIVNLVAGYF